MIYLILLSIILYGCPDSVKAREIEPESAIALEKIKEADRLALTYDYTGAIELLKTIEGAENDSTIQKKIDEYQQIWDNCVTIKPEEVTHIFYHSLVVDPDLAFDRRKPCSAGFKQWMTTVVEFKRVTQAMYDNGYVLIRMKDMVVETIDAQGISHFKPNPDLRLPAGKKAFVLSLDDICYYHSQDGRGIATKLVLDDNGKPTCEYVEKDGSIVTGAFDSVPLLDEFIEEHPDASFHGAKGIIALTGYNGILGYRTANAYKQGGRTPEQQAFLKAHPGFDWDAEREEAKKVAEAIKADGWEFANHTYSHIRIADVSLERLISDTAMWEREVVPLIGNTDTIIFAFGQDLEGAAPYSLANAKYAFLRKHGYNYFCNVDSYPFRVQLRDGYLRQGRRNIDGYRLWNDVHGRTNRTKDLFDAKQILDERRTDVPAL